MQRFELHYLFSQLHHNHDEHIFLKNTIVTLILKYFYKSWMQNAECRELRGWHNNLKLMKLWSEPRRYLPNKRLSFGVSYKQSLSDFLEEWLDFTGLASCFQYCSGHRTVTVRENCHTIVADTLCSDSLILLVVNCPIWDPTDVKKTNILASTLMILHYDDLVDTCIRTSWSIFAIDARCCCDMSSNFEGHFGAVKCEER